MDGDHLTSAAQNIVAEIGDSWDQGLNPENYHYNQLKAFKDNGIPKGRESESEMLFSRSVLQFGRDLSGMRLSAKTFEADPTSWSRGIDGYSLLKVLSEESDPAGFLEQLPPQDEVYSKLRSELKDIALDLGKHPDREPQRIAYPGTLKPGIRHAAILAIRKRLGDSSKSDVYDEPLKAKVEEFQRQHGLAADGLIGPRSFDAINQTRTQKLVKLIANLERRRWVRRPMPPRYIAVNIPQMELKAVEDSEVKLEMPVIVGRLERPTMSFVSEIVGVRFNPSWYVPDTIKTEDYLPKLQKDPNALSDHSIKFRVKSEDGNIKEVASSDIDWASVTPDKLKEIQMFQGPGEDNALGLIRVLMPNRYDIYLHDTNAPKLFAKDDRTLSSGCVRLSEPRRIANFILGSNDDWADSKIDTYIARQKLIEVKAQHRLPVYIFYYTAWLDKSGNVVIANDVYGEDKKLVDALAVAGKLPFEISKGR